MNRYLRRVIGAYVLAVLAAVLYSPWKLGISGSAVHYAVIWDPPKSLGTPFLLDCSRLALELVSLTLVLLAAVVSLWGDEEGR